MPDPGPIGQVVDITATSPPVVTLDADSDLADGQRVALRAAYPAAVLAYVKAVKNGPPARRFELYDDAALTAPQARAASDIPPSATVLRLAENDWAIVVAIDFYFFENILPRLQGPKRDANIFEQWLKESAYVPDDQIIRLPANTAQAPNAEAAIPTADSVSEAFLSLLSKEAVRRRGRLGRRLYIFVSGHGIVPLRSEIPDYHEAALLMANAHDAALNRHAATRSYAEYFRARGIFDEVLLFADCCRELKNMVPLQSPPLPSLSLEQRPGRYFYAASTALGSKSWEKFLGNPAARRGVFTYALMEALNNPDICDDQGRLTADVLRKFLEAKVPELADKQVPDIDFRPSDADLVIIKKPSRPKANIEFAAQYAGKSAKLYLGTDTKNPIAEERIQNDKPWQVSVRLNHIYKVAVDGTSAAKLFEALEAITDVRVE
jgi:Caspase domain